jgi:hypothetical protein
MVKLLLPLLLIIAPFFTAQADVCRKTKMAGLEGRPAEPVTVCASTVRTRAGPYRFGPELAVDGKKDTTWSEGDPGNGLGNWFMLKFPKTKSIRHLALRTNRAEFDVDLTLFTRLKEVVLETSDGLRVSARLKDTERQQFITLPRTVDADWIKITIVAVFEGTGGADTGIAEIHPVPAGLEPVPNAPTARTRPLEETPPIRTQ